MSFTTCFFLKNRLIIITKNKERNIRLYRISVEGYAFNRRSGIEKKPQIKAAKTAAKKWTGNFFDIKTYLQAMTDISTFTAFGNPAACMVSLAGKSFSK